jgi:hypothetical protein
MKILLSLLLTTLLSVNADAQAPQINRIDVTEYGIYTSTTRECEPRCDGQCAQSGYLATVQETLSGNRWRRVEVSFVISDWPTCMLG